MGKENKKIDNPVIIVTLVGVIVALFSIIANNRLTLWRTRRDEYLKAYSIFSGFFIFIIQQLETGGTDLNPLLLSEFPKHDLAKRDFIQHLSSSRKTRFLHIWEQYEEKYTQVKELGIFGIVAAIAPNIESLNNVKSPADMDHWELDRKNELHKIIHGLLDVAQNKYWL